MSVRIKALASTRLTRTETRSQTANCGNDSEWQCRARYCSRPTRQSLYSDSGLKKKLAGIETVNPLLLGQLQPENIEVEIQRVEELEEESIEQSELDEMWRFVGKKTNPRWLWHAIDRNTGQVLAYVFGRRSDEVFLQLKVLLEPFGIKKYCTDGWGAYERHLPAELHEVGKRKTQRIERKHLRLRTRIKRLVRKKFAFLSLK